MTKTDESPKEQPRTAVRKKLFLNALAKSLGVWSPALRELGLSRNTVKDWERKDAKFAAALGDIKEEALDFSEIALRKEIKKGNIIAIKYHLSTQGKSRGYTERTEITGADGKDLFSQKTDEELLSTIAELQKKLQS